MNHAAHDTGPAHPPVLLPTDRPRRPGAPARCSAVETTGLDAYATVPGLDRQAAQAAAFAALLHRYTGQDGIGYDRTDETGTTHVQLRINGTRTLREVAGALTTGPRPAADTVPLALVFADPAQPAQSPALYELRLVVRDGLAEIHYDPALFDAATARRILTHYRTLLLDALSRPDVPLAHLRLLTDGELQQMLVDWNRTETPLTDHGFLHEAFEGHAERRPDATAAVHEGARFTYGEVNTAANRLAHHLRSLGIGPDARVGLCLERSPELLIAMLGILKAGGAYVPLDPDYPAQRIAAMVEGTTCAVTVSRAELASRLPATAGSGTPLVLLGPGGTDLSQHPAHNPAPVTTPDHLCYVIHTSGSTGAPKPIALHHRGVVNNIADLNSRFKAGPGDSVLSLSSPSFDLSVYEYLGITAAGGAVVIPSAARAKDPAYWTELLTEHGVTVWNSAPALLDLLVDHLEQSGAEPLHQLRAAMLGGDWIPVPLPGRAREVAPGMRLITMGGATEASIHSTIYEVVEADPDWASIPYGRPMANQRTYILDDAFQPVPPGVPGELYLAGTGVARGYLDQPERTAERFLQWSHAGVSDRIYRTGDLARFGEDGLIELLGRKDFQVKLNGLRVELGEIEAVLRSHPAVQQSAVVAHRSQLVAYVVVEDSEGADLQALHRLAADRLPEYMVPKVIVPLDRLPLTPNGKVDRKALPEPDLSGADYRAPRTPREKALAEVFADVLHTERIGIDDDFVALGGDSIRAIQAVTRARTRGLAVTPRLILQLRTVALVAEAAQDAADTEEDTPSTPLLVLGADDTESLRRRYPRMSDVWPLTPMQSGMLFESMLADAGSDTYHLQTVYHLSGPVDAARMRTVGQSFLDRYANLTAAFVPDASGDLVQVVSDGVELPWREIDLSDLADADQDEAFARFLAEDQGSRFDLATPPLLRLTLIRFSPEKHELVLTAHHVLIDGWSEQLIAEDLLRLYAAGEDASTLAPVRSYRDFLAWLARQDGKESAQAWADELDGLDGATIVAPEAGAGSGEPLCAVGEVALTLTPQESHALAGRGAELGITVNTLVQGAWAILLSALTGRQDVVFGAAVSGRPGTLPGVETMVGLFINTLPVRAQCRPGSTLPAFLTDLQSRQTALLDHHHHSLTDIHQAAGLDALFDTIVAFQSYPSDPAGHREAAAAAGFEITGLRSVGGANYPLALIVEDSRLTLQYQPHLFDEDAARDIAGRFRSILGQLATGAGLVGGIDLLVDTERAHLLAAGAPARDGTQDSPGGPHEQQTAADRFEQHAAATPGQAAVTFGDTSLTFAELNAHANRLAHNLIRLGAGPETVVGLALPRSADLAIALLATLKTGAGYALLSPDQSPARRDTVLAQAAPELILASPDAAPELALTDIPLVHLEDMDRTRGPDTDPVDGDRNAPVRHGNLACVRYGPLAPGGVALSHRALADGVRRFATAAGITPGATVLATSHHADTAVFELLGAVCSGAGVELAQDLGALATKGWTGDVISTAAPLLAAALNRSTAAIQARTVVFTGDVLLGSFVQRVRKRIPGVRVVNAYGPTETVRATALAAAEGWHGEGAAPLGSVLGAMRAYVLSPALQLLPPGVTGELYVAGEVARGYQGQAGLTSQHFVADPFGPPGSRMYRTGDLARWNSQGALEYVGRSGPPARIRGHQFRTEDVEAALAAHPSVSQAVVVTAPDGDDQQLLGYVVPLRNETTDAAQLREFLGGRLPDHMVPTTFVLLAELPSTAEGGVDHQALPAPGDQAAGEGYRAGRTPQEEALCALFAEVLGVERVGIDDSFFSLGGNSLKATRLIGRMRRSLGIETSIRTIFQYSTIAELSGQVQAISATKSRPRLRKMTKE
ncbi:amino acid adenylation domain-containing protein [Streptomyces sp. NPDC057298]|uniref:amino acid adenylation domain-containing protein n=1 Tax=Streptomyces sp. NPDC057298 TaxID=3346091 RepID=UPI003627EEF1